MPEDVSIGGYKYTDLLKMSDKEFKKVCKETAEIASACEGLAMSLVLDSMATGENPKERLAEDRKRHANAKDAKTKVISRCVDLGLIL